MDSREEQEQRVITAWIVAGRELSIRVIAPFEFRAGVASYSCVACLPDFGGTLGMIIEAIFPPSFARSKALAHDAGAAGYFVSSINADLYERFDRDTFRDALVDWGYCGPAELRPQWLE